MKFLIDTQSEKLIEKIRLYPDLVLGQLLTPLTRYKNFGGQYAIDNGAFSKFNEVDFLALRNREKKTRDKCLFVVCPDIVANARRTLEIFQRRKNWILGTKVALVAQDGIENLEIPWDELDCLFVGGGDPWKDSKAVVDIVKTAKILGKWVHVGRVNTPKRFKHFREIGADTCDGSGIARFDHMLDDIAKSLEPEESMFDEFAMTTD